MYLYFNNYDLLTKLQEGVITCLFDYFKYYSDRRKIIC